MKFVAIFLLFQPVSLCQVAQIYIYVRLFLTAKKLIR